MAIKLPDPGNGIPEQKTGNDEWTNMKIVRDNFADQSNAASKLVGSASGQVPLNSHLGTASKVNVGTSDGQIPLAEDIQAVAFGRTIESAPEGVDAANLKKGFIYTNANTTGLPPQITSSYLGVLNTFAGYYSSAGPTDSQYFYSYFDDNIYFRGRRFRDAAYRDWRLIYHSGNTTKDSATGFLKVSSPVLHVYNDSITKIHEAEQLDITVEKKSVGHYEIHGTTGLRKNDGWFMSPPRDVHGNVLCMVDIEEKDGVVILRTYKKKFDFETVSIVHDFDNPMDIPDGVCVEFRFNDLPQDEVLDEPAI
ncbi:hypothetical protein [Psychrobacter sp. UBA3962]|uniref:phage tail fiber protein n=1 Tax=Psychrobacter sp. UBA3962 TaxID=1947352 RepID=UPI0025E651AC|nr:hypothetical protein [Psychrobacter sp. UBA3962]